MDVKRLNELKIDRFAKGKLSHLIRYSLLTEDEKNDLLGIIELITIGVEKREIIEGFSIAANKNK